MDKTLKHLQGLHQACSNAKDFDACADAINSQAKIIRDIRDYLLEEDWSAYKLDYESEADLTEKDKPRLVVLYVKAIHDIFYQWATEINDFILNGEEEMSVLPAPIMYYVHISVRPELNNRFHALLLVYALEACISKYYYVSIDFEQSTVYTEKEIRLTQLCFEHPKDKRSMIMIINPTDLTETMTRDYIDLLFCNKRIIKIVHGSDSQDVPYIYHKLLANDTDKIIEFTQTMIDTRFLCEYYRLNIGEIPSNRCKIYDQDPEKSGVYILGVVSEEQQQKLASVLASMGHHLDITWDIRNMSRAQTMYAIYDVIYLKYFYYHLINLATKASPPNEIKNTIDLYKLGLNQLTRFSYLENREITYLEKTCKEQMNPANNYFIVSNKRVIKMIDMYNEFSKGLVVTSMNVAIDDLLKVNHLRRYILIVIKRLIYGSMTQHCRLRKNRDTPFTEKWSNDIIFDFFERLDFRYLVRLFRELDQILAAKILQRCKA